MRKKITKKKKKRKGLGYWVPPSYGYPPMLTSWMTKIETSGKKKRKEPRALRKHHY